MGFLDWIFNSGARGGDERLLSAVDRVLEGVDPRLKYIGGARTRLVPAVGQALQFARETIAAIPPPVALLPEQWSATPLLRAVFARPADMVDLLAGSDEVRRFLDDTATPAGAALHAVVAATRVERTVLGAGLDGDTLRQDVLRRTVSFGDFSVAAVSASEAATRRRIEDFVLEQLVLATLEEIAAERRHSEELVKYRHLLLTRLNLMTRSGANLDALYGTSGVSADDLDRLRSELAANEAELQAARHAVGLENALDHLVEALRHAEDVIRPKRLTFRVDAMNALVDDADDPSAQTVELLEFSTAVPERPRRVAFLASFAPQAVPRRHMDLDAALRFL